jgi:two-component system cell cycle response regulator
MKILVAEDDSITRHLMQRTLQKFGYEVVLAEDGHKALEILSEKTGPRLALVDWMMPLLDGPELCRRVRSQQSDGSYVYIVLLTSKHGSDDIVEGLEAGADDYITKPFQPAELKARLRTGLRILSLEDKLVKARDEMRFGATHDMLTSLWNRGAILSLTKGELSRTTRERRPCSLLLCDVDHFKRVNDNYGHLVGDFVLKEVARRLKSCVRDYDGVGRYGGEEFLLVLGNCGNGCIESRAEAVRAAIANSPFLLENGTELSITISIGSLTCEVAQAARPVESLLAQADAALYQAKKDGRNRTVKARQVDGNTFDGLTEFTSELPVTHR